MNAKTIKVESRLREVFNYLPDMKFGFDGPGFKPTFKEGDQKELLAFFAQSEKNSNYPLIWLDMPYTEEHISDKTVKVQGMNLILAVETTSSLLNSERMETTFEKVLYPLLDNILIAFTQASTISYNLQYKITKYCNYSDQIYTNKSEIQDLWDAIRLTVDIEINNRCLREIKF